jgi:23S rRNA (adenine2503-C2)-methyltransferase
MKTDLAGLELKELEDFVVSLGHKKFHAKQIYNWIWKRGITDFTEMTNLSRELRAALEEKAIVPLPDVTQHHVSEDGTQKFVLRLADGKQIEAVFIPDTPKQTFCVSTQVGCAMGCAFCLTGKMGLVRHLTASEIAGQVRLLARSLHLLDKSFNIVLMGMGEPLQNYDNTMKAMRMLNEKEGLDSRPRPADGQAGTGRADAEPRGIAACGIGGTAGRHRAAEQEVLDAGRDRRLQTVSPVEAAPHHVRVRDAGRHQRLG